MGYLYLCCGDRLRVVDAEMSRPLKIDEHSAQRWLKRRGGCPKDNGIGYIADITFDTSKIKTLQHFANEAALRRKFKHLPTKH